MIFGSSVRLNDQELIEYTITLQVDCCVFSRCGWGRAVLSLVFARPWEGVIIGMYIY